MSDTTGSGIPGIDPTAGTDLPGQPDPLATNPDNLSSPFLAKIPEADRPVVARYIQDWDRGVQQRFQAIHEQYKPYKEFGDAADVEKAIKVSQLLDADPEQVFNLLARELGYQVGAPEPQRTSQSDFQNPWEDLGIPDEFANMVVQQQNLLEALVAKVSGIDTATQDQQDQAALDDLLGALHDKYGDYDETYVMAHIVQGMDPEAAVDQWNNSIQSAINSRSSRPAPTVLGGSGTVPQSGVDPRKMSGQDVRNFLADQLTAINAQK